VGNGPVAGVDPRGYANLGAMPTGEPPVMLPPDPVSGFGGLPTSTTVFVPVGGRSGAGSSLPIRGGPPNGSLSSDNGDGTGTIRDYGPDGNATTDNDFGHSHGGSTDPHGHDWDWSGPKPIRGRPRPPAPSLPSNSGTEPTGGEDPEPPIYYVFGEGGYSGGTPDDPGNLPPGYMTTGSSAPEGLNGEE